MHRLTSLAFASLLLAAAAAAQTAPAAADDPETRVITVQNLAPFARREWVQAVVPFARGSVAELPQLHVEGLPTVWEAFGARWPDGSLRQALCLFPCELAPLQEKHLSLAAGPGPKPAAPKFDLADRKLRFIAVVDGQRHVCEPEVVEILASNDARQVYVLRGRVGSSGFVVEATVEVYAYQAHAWLGFGMFFSDPSSPKMEVQVDRLVVETEGMALLLRHSKPLGVQSVIDEKGARHVILQSQSLADGMGLRRTGVLVPPLGPEENADDKLRNDTLRAAALCRPMAATPWTDSGAFGAFGKVPPPPPWLRGEVALRAAFQRQHSAFVNASKQSVGDPLREAIYGPARSAGRGGEQADFGIVALEPVAYTGIPSLLYEVEWSVLQEACRPVHNFEVDASPVLSANHPDWVIWDGRTHWHCEVSTDRLGKPCPVPKFDTHSWKGKDREHWSNNYLCAYYMLTADPSVLLEIRNEAQLYLAGQTVEPRFSTSGTGNARACGRAMLSASWLYLCTGDPAVLKRMQDRMEMIYHGNWKGRDLAPDLVRPFQVKKNDPRYGVSGDWAWVPWEEGLIPAGFAAYLALVDDPDPKLVEMTDITALNLLKHAWRIPTDGSRPQIVYAMAWHDGKPFSEAERGDPTKVMWPGANFGMWAMSSLAIARQAALRRGDAELAELATRGLEGLRKHRDRPKNSFYDRLPMWDGVP